MLSSEVCRELGDSLYAGFAAFLRLARVGEQGLRATVVDFPDQWRAVPAPLPTVRGS